MQPAAASLLCLLGLTAAPAGAATLTGTLGPNAPGEITTDVSSESMQPFKQSDLALVGWKDYQLGHPYLDLGAVTVNQSTVTITASPDKPAVLYAFIYGCYPCPSTHGGFIGHVLNYEGWRLGYCAPELFSAQRDRTFRLVSYAKDIAAGETYTLTMPGDADYVAFVAVEDFLDCANLGFGDPYVCEALETAPYQFCKWDDGECKPSNCHGNIGPTKTKCVAEGCATSASFYYE